MFSRAGAGVVNEEPEYYDTVEAENGNPATSTGTAPTIVLDQENYVLKDEGALTTVSTDNQDLSTNAVPKIVLDQESYVLKDEGVDAVAAAVPAYNVFKDAASVEQVASPSTYNLFKATGMETTSQVESSPQESPDVSPVVLNSQV